MKMLYLIRHAKSSWDDRSISDFERPLNKRGKRDAPLLADLLRRERISPDLIVSSPAKRALETALIFAEVLSFGGREIIIDGRIYEGGTIDLASVASGIPDENRTMLLFGHNPGISNFANFLSSRPVPEMPTCTVAGLRLDVKSWGKIERDCGELIFFRIPSESKK
jgi:phosphohistidine phosphatase